MGIQFHFRSVMRTATEITDEGMFSDKKINFLQSEP